MVRTIARQVTKAEEQGPDDRGPEFIGFLIVRLTTEHTDSSNESTFTGLSFLVLSIFSGQASS